MLPYLGFPLVRACPLRCRYCGVGAEAAASSVPTVDLRTLKQWTESSLRLGIRKFRLTGGEPLLHPEIAEILSYFSNVDATCTLNTAAFLVDRRASIFEGLGPSLTVICSLDALDETRFDRITGSRGWYKPTIEGIQFLARLRLLKRLNMMVVKENVDAIPEMIEFCSTLGCNLKISDIAKTPDQFGDWRADYVDLSEVERSLSSTATNVAEHPYTQLYGIPSKIYTVNGIEITIKSSANGTRYAIPGPCSSCAHFPCEEGMYFINVLPDGTASACRQNMFHIIAMPEDFAGTIKKMIDLMRGTVLLDRNALTAQCAGGFSPEPIGISSAKFNG